MIGLIVFWVLAALIIGVGAWMGWKDWKRGPRMLGGFPVPPGMEGVALASMRAREKDEESRTLSDAVKVIAEAGVAARDAERAFRGLRELLEADRERRDARAIHASSSRCEDVPAQDETREDFDERMGRARVRRYEQRSERV